jgi:glycosyltransferase involved in cell wall biosynthesis
LAGTHLWGLIEDRRVDDLLTRIATTAFGPRQVRRPSSTNRLRLAFVMRHVLDTRGGARSFFHLADGLRQHGFETRLYLLESSPESKIQQRFEEAGIPIRLIEPAPQHLKRADNLRQQLKDDAIDVVLNYDMGDWLVGLLALSGGEVPVSIYHHFSDHLFSAGIHLLDCHLAFRRAGLRSCQDNHETARCAYLPLPGSDVAPVVERSLETRHTLGIPPEATVSITVTNLNKLAGSTMYFDVLDRVLKEHPHHHHLLVGGGSPVWVDFAKQEIAARHTANRFHLLGPRKDIGALLAGSDVFVDSYPIAGYTASLEAMQAGLPVLELTLDRPPIFGIADDLADVRCIAVSEEDFVRLISRYITDRPYRVHVGRDLRDHYQREYAPSVVVARYADFIRTLLADKSAPLSPPSSNTGPRYNAPLQLGNSDERQPQDYLLDGFSAACRSHSLNGRLDITRHLLGQTPVLAGRRRFWSALLQRQQRNANSLLDLTSS